MPKKAGGGADADEVVESEPASGPPRGAGSSIAFPPIQDEDSSSDAESAAALAAGQPARTPAFVSPRPLSEVNFDDAKPAPSPFPGPRALAETDFDEAPPESPRPAPPTAPSFQGAVGGPVPQAPRVASASGMGISIAGAPGMVPTAPKQTPAQMAAANQALRIRLLRADGKPFDGPEITTGPKQADAAPGGSRTEFDAPRGPKKQAPKVVVKAGPAERVGHTLAVLAISAVGIVPLAYLLLKSVHDREDKLAATIKVPTKMNVLDGTSEAYLGGMAAVLLVVAAVYAARLKRRRAR